MEKYSYYILNFLFVVITGVSVYCSYIFEKRDLKAA